MKRREFIGVIGGAAVAWPLAVRAQQGERMRRVAFLHAYAENDPEVLARIVAFRQALERLGWTLTKFNRKLDNVCEKLDQIGIRGLHGDPRRLAGGRRARLVEYALAARLVTPTDLVLLD